MLYNFSCIHEKLMFDIWRYVKSQKLVISLWQDFGFNNFDPRVNNPLDVLTGGPIQYVKAFDV